MTSADFLQDYAPDFATSTNAVEYVYVGVFTTVVATATAYFLYTVSRR